MPTMTRPIDADYRRVISAKFDRTRSGAPITCRYCANVVVIGRDFAAVDADGKWHNVCTVCAVSRPAQVAGLVGKMETLAATLTGAALDTLMAEAADIDAMATAAIGGDEQAARAVTPQLLAMLAQVRTVATVQAAASDPFAVIVERLRAVLSYFVASRDISFTQSLVSQWDSKGRLSDLQRPYVEKFVVQGEALQAEKELTPVTQAILDRALVVDAEGEHHRPSLRFAIPSGGHNDLDFLCVYVGRVERHIGGVNNGEPVVIKLATPQALTLARRINEMDDESFVAAQARYGSAMGHCGRCGSALSDLVSRAQGFGPDCITKVGL